MTHWCLGFAFSEDLSNVMLLKKSRTLHVGLWNGVGGKLEANESSLAAMQRECTEEAKVQIHDWNLVGYLFGKNKDWQVDIYAGKIPAGEVSYLFPEERAWRGSEPDTVYRIPLVNLGSFDLAPHTRPLIYASLDKRRYPDCGLIQLEEI